jgi:hypothetical protein
MSLPRETATHAPDLPHKHQGKISLPCALCGEPAFELRHVAWEKANEDTTADPILTLPRETGV